MFMKKRFFEILRFQHSILRIFQGWGRERGGLVHRFFRIFQLVPQNRYISISRVSYLYMFFFLTNLQTLIVAGNCTHFRMVLQRQSNNAISVFAQYILYDLQIQRYRQFKRGLLKNIETFILIRPGSLFLDNKLTLKLT